MRFAAVLNKDGGTLRTTDLDDLSRHIEGTLSEAGHSVDIDIVSGDEVAAALDRAVARRGVDVVLVGGGDGTVSTAAAKLKDRKKALAVLPAGTMNLFARSLGIPQTLQQAVAAFANGQIVAVDIASANGTPFVHQFSIGMHARMVRLREKMDFGSRLGKIRASVRAAWMTLRDPRPMKVTLKIGKADIVTRTTGIGVTNNLFGEGHLPYADYPAGGVLGVYITVARQRGELLKFAYNLVRGRWRENEHVDVHQAGDVTLTIGAKSKRMSAVLDGELVTLERETSLKIHPGALRVLVPAEVASTLPPHSGGKTPKRAG